MLFLLSYLPILLSPFNILLGFLSLAPFKVVRLLEASLGASDACVTAGGGDGQASTVGFGADVGGVHVGGVCAGLVLVEEVTVVMVLLVVIEVALTVLVVLVMVMLLLVAMVVVWLQCWWSWCGWQ